MIIKYAWASDKTMKPCPFCGKRNTFCTIETTNIKSVANKPVYDAVVNCHHCGATVHHLEVDMDLAASMARTAWQTRAGDEE